MTWIDALAAEIAGELETARADVLQWTREEQMIEDRIGSYLHAAHLEERLGSPLQAAEWYVRAGRELVDADDPLDGAGTDLGSLWAALDAFHTAVVLACGSERVQHAIAQEYLPVFEEAWQIDRGALAREAMFAALLCKRLGDPERAAYYFEESARCLESEASRTGNERARRLAQEAWESCARILEHIGDSEEAARVRDVASMRGVR